MCYRQRICRFVIVVFIIWSVFFFFSLFAISWRWKLPIELTSFLVLHYYRKQHESSHRNLFLCSGNLITTESLKIKTEHKIEKYHHYISVTFLTCVSVILVMMASIIFSPFVGYGFFRCSYSQAFSVLVVSLVAFFLLAPLTSKAPYLQKWAKRKTNLYNVCLYLFLILSSTIILLVHSEMVVKFHLLRIVIKNKMGNFISSSMIYNVKK